MLITFTHAYRPCWLANTIELCTKQLRNRVYVTHPLAVYKTVRCSLILPTKTLVRTRYVQFTYFMGRVHQAQCRHASIFPMFDLSDGAKCKWSLITCKLIINQEINNYKPLINTCLIPEFANWKSLGCLREICNPFFNGTINVILYQRIMLLKGSGHYW